MKLQDVIFVRRKKPVIVNNLNFDPKTMRGMEMDITFLAFPNKEQAEKSEKGDARMHESPTAFGDTTPHVTAPFPYEEITLEEASKYPILTWWYEEWEERVGKTIRPWETPPPAPITQRLRALLDMYAEEGL